jgi:EmrB/QacA subfamily drug resistance transporter
MKKIGNLINDGNRKWWILVTVCFALFMIILDGNVVNLAIPSILKTFNASISQVEWVSNAYLLVFAILLITLGRLGDEFGRKKLFIFGLFVFTIGSMLCGISRSIDMLIFFRCLQGIGGAAMMPATLSLITVNFEPKERGVALGIWGAISGLGIVCGPIIGGYLTQSGLGSSLNSFLHISNFWRYVFFINLPVGILAIIAAFLIIPESKDREKKHPVDIVGILLSATSIFFLTFAFIESTTYGWLHASQVFSAFGIHFNLGWYSIIPVFFIISALFGFFFYLWERQEDKEPLIDMKLFRDHNYAVGNFVTMVLSFAMMGSFFLFPLFLQSVLGFSPSKTGLVLIPLALAMIVIAPIAGKFSDHIGPKYLVSLGLFIMAFGEFLTAHFKVNTTSAELILPFIVMGLGMGLIQAPISSAVLKNVPPDEAGGASGVVTTIRQIGAVMGIAILGAALQSYLVTNVNQNLNHVANLPNQVKQQVMAETKSGNVTNSAGNNTADLNSMLASQIQKSVPMPDLTKIPVEERAGVVAQLTAAKNQITAEFTKIGNEIVSSIKQGFTDSINSTIKISVLITLFGAFAALLLENPKKKRKPTE